MIATGENRQLCTFFVDGQLFGIDVTDVQEVMRGQRMTPVPLAPRVVKGLIHLRGQIVTALDMRARLGLPEAKPEQEPMNVLVRDTDGGVALLVDDIGDVLHVPEASFERAPDTMPNAFKELISGIYKLDGRLLLVLDVARITAPQSRTTEPGDPRQ